MALDLIRDADGDVVGVTALEMETGDLHILEAKTVLLATGGAGRIFAASTNAFINTGDGLGMAARAGIPLQDMEFWQFHPTGVAGAGVLLTEGCRGEGAILLNSNGERFMERYAPTLKDLAPRDFVSRCMDQEIKEGRGCGPNKDYINLKLDHLGADTIHKRLPSVYEIGVNFANVDITREPIPVVPTIHYQMGGVPTNINGQVVVHSDGVQPGGQRPVRRGRMFLRERARRQPPGHQLPAGPAGVRPRGRQPHRRVQQPEQAAQAAARQRRGPHAGAAQPPGKRQQRRIRSNSRPTTFAAPCRNTPACSAPRPAWTTGVHKIAAMRERVNHIDLGDKSKVFNTARIEALEVENLIEAAQATMTCRPPPAHECRGAHTVDDYERDASDPKCPLGRDDAELAQAHAVGQRQQLPELQAREPQAPDGRQRGPQGPHVLTSEALKRKHTTWPNAPSASTATTRTRTPSPTCRPSRSNSTAASACCWTR